MLASDTLKNRSSEIRQRMGELVNTAEATDVELAEIETLRTELKSVETRARAAVELESAQGYHDDVVAASDSSEAREIADLKKRSRVSSFFISRARGAQVSGPEAELMAALHVFDGIPFALFDRPEDHGTTRTRAVTTEPSPVGINLQPVQPFVFADSLAGRLGIEMREVPSGTYAIPTITTAPASGAAPVAVGGAADSTAGVLTVQQASPKRIPAELQLPVEAIASVGTDNFEESLRQALRDRLSAAVDEEVINGNGAGQRLNGIINQLTAPSAAGALVTWPSSIESLAAFVEGIWANTLAELSVVVGLDSYRLLSSTFQTPTTSGANGEISAADYLSRSLASFTTHSRMPATASSGTLNKNQTFIVARMGQPGLTRAVMPLWGSISIDDIFTGASTGTRKFVVSVMGGNLLLVQSAAYALGALQVEA